MAELNSGHSYFLSYEYLISIQSLFGSEVRGIGQLELSGFYYFVFFLGLYVIGISDSSGEGLNYVLWKLKRN